MALSFNSYGPHEIRLEPGDVINGNDDPIRLLGIASDGVTEIIQQNFENATPDDTGPETMAESYAVGTRMFLEFTLHKLDPNHLFNLIQLFNSATGALPVIGKAASAISLAPYDLGNGSDLPIACSILPVSGGTLARTYACVVPERIRLVVGPQHTTAEIRLQVMSIVDTGLNPDRRRFWAANPSTTPSPTGTGVRFWVTGAHNYQHGEDLDPLGCSSGGSEIVWEYNWIEANSDCAGPQTSAELFLGGVTLTVTPLDGLQYFDPVHVGDFQWLKDDDLQASEGILDYIGLPTVGDGTYYTGQGERLVLDSTLGVAQPNGGCDFTFFVTRPEAETRTQMPTGHATVSATFAVMLSENRNFFSVEGNGVVPT